MFYDALLHIGKPDNIGLPKAAIYYHQDLWPTTDRTQPPKGYTRKAGDIAVIDIEVWPWHQNQWWADTVHNFRLVDPGSRVGFYGFPDSNRIHTERDASQAGPGMTKVRADHDALPMLRHESDILTPALYTRSPDIEAWAVTALRTIKEAKRIGEACYPFLWFEYHDTLSTNPGETLSDEMWRVQLEICRSYADGAIIWGGNKRQWDANASWFKVLQEFV